MEEYAIRILTQAHYFKSQMSVVAACGTKQSVHVVSANSPIVESMVYVPSLLGFRVTYTEYMLCKNCRVNSGAVLSAPVANRTTVTDK
jgi:hypothetical protein